jgi:D-3-phosphoglycerate dehydrogenase
MTHQRPLRALLLEGIHPGARDVLASEGIAVTLLDKSPPKADLPSMVSEYDILGIRSKTQVTAEVPTSCWPWAASASAPTRSTSWPRTRAACPVFNAPFSNTRSVAELIIGEIIMLSRQLGDRSREVHAGQWRKVATGCHEVRGKTLGIVGYGHIGSQVGVLAEAMGMRVVFYDVASKLPMGNNRPMPHPRRAARRVDFVTLHVPETPQTRDDRRGASSRG